MSVVQLPISLHRLGLVLALILFSTAGCSGLPLKELAGLGASTPSQGVISTPPPVTLTAPPGGAADQTPTPIDLNSSPVTLRVWLPPQFDPSASTPASSLLQARLTEFTQRRPGIHLEIRIKATDGPGGMLDAISAASAAAPQALPDLTALPRSVMEMAALKGLLHPFTSLNPSLDDPDWYDFARQLARLQNSTFGLPFAGDALLMVYRPGAVSEAPHDWETTLKLKGPLVFPAADPQALYTLSLYQAAGGSVQDSQGRPSLDKAPLEKVLTFYQQGGRAGLMPAWLAQIESDDQAWSAFQDGRANVVLTWSSYYLSQAKTQSSSSFTAALLPSPQGSSSTLALGWVWALASPQSERQELAAQLAEFLTDSKFIAAWTEAAGYLPPRASALANWTDSTQRSLVSQVVATAHLSPSSDVLASLAEPLREATVKIIQVQGDPASLTQNALDQLKNP
jgi:multiple sugar transport system substrate-binding protein